MTPVESDQRNRIRNLQNARDALARGDSQSAANSLAHSLAAQRSLDGGTPAPIREPDDSPEPHRDFQVSPSDVPAATAQLEQVNRERGKVGSAPVEVEVTRQYHKTSDPIIAWEQATVRVSGASQAELEGIGLGRVRTGAEQRVQTTAVMSVAVAATRLNGGVYVPASEGADSVPAQVNAYIQDGPGSHTRKRLAPTQEDVNLGGQARIWVRGQQPTTDYMRAVRHSMSQEYMGFREVNTAASALAGFQRYRNRVDALPQDEPDAVYSPRPQGSRWLNQPGDKVTVKAHVEKVVPVHHPNRRSPAFLYVMRTPDGDLVRWMASSTQGMQENDDITLQGTVKAHSTFNGERQTEMYYCKPRIHSPI